VPSPGANGSLPAETFRSDGGGAGTVGEGGRPGGRSAPRGLTDSVDVAGACSVRGVFVGRDDQAALLACFDETGTTVFAVLCQLCAGDADLAVELLGETYAHVRRTAASSYGVDADRRWMIDAAHNIYAARAPAGRNEIGPVAALAPRDRVIVRLHDGEHRGPSEIALLLGIPIDDVERSLSEARAVLTTSTMEAFKRGDVWFDDAMRAAARARISGPITPAKSDDDQDGFGDDPAPALISRRTMVGAGATASIAAMIGLGLWFGSSDSDRASMGKAIPEPPAATATTSPTTTSPTTTRPAVITTAPATDDTLVLGSEVSHVAVTTSIVAVPETGFIIDPVPEGLVPAGGYLSSGEGSPLIGWFQLWASTDAAHTAGRWLAINVTSVNWSAPQPATNDTRRVDLGGHPALVTTDGAGIISVASSAAEDTRLALQAYGVSVDEIGRLIGSMTLTADNEPTFASAADAVLDGLDLRISRSSSSFDLFGVFAYGGDRAAFYSAPDSHSSVEVYAQPQKGDDLLTSVLLGPPSTDPIVATYAPAGTIEIAGRQVRIFDLGRPFLQWHDGNDTITLSGDLPLSDLLEAAATTRPASAEEWRVQINTNPTYSDDTDSGLNSQEPERVEITQRDSASEPGVVVRMATELDESGQRTLEISAGDGMLSGISVDPSKPVTVFVDIDVTIIVAVFESPGLGKKLRVSLSGRPAVIMPLVPLGDSGDYGAAYAFSEIADFSVALVDTDGTLIQELGV
jgi:hypothetical protein